MKIPMIILGIVFLILQEPKEIKYHLLIPEDFNNSYRAEIYALIIDTRSSMEFRRKRLINAHNFPTKKSIDSSVDTLDLETPLYIYCTTDTRAIGAAKYFLEKEFKTVYVLDGGIKQWQKEGFPVDRARIRKTKLYRE